MTGARPDRPDAPLCGSPASPSPQGNPAWIPKEVFRLSHTRNWRMGYE
jgi:hypothetical protein